MPRKGKRRVEEDSDDEEGHFFPNDLLDSVNDNLWTSPTKAQRTVGVHKRAPKKVFDKRPGGDEDLADAYQADYGLDLDDGPASGASGPGMGPDPGLPLTTDDQDVEFEDFADAVASEVAGFYHLHGSLFAVQGWDTGRSRTTDAWYHLRYQRSSDEELDSGCTCPKALNRDLCVHRRYFKEYEVESLIRERADAEGEKHADAPAATLFVRRVVGSYSIQSLFSVKSMSSAELKGRAIVAHEVSRKGASWKCSKDNGLVSCFHIVKAQEEYPEISEEDIDILDDFVDSSLYSVSVGELARGPGTTVSYLPVHPPLWSRLPGDPILYPEPPPMRVPEETLFRLSPDSTCSCPSGRTAFNPDGDKKVRTAKLYTILGLYAVQIEVQPCPVCPKPRRKCIGPDLRSQGIFNFNNSVLVSHELLNEYTSSFTSSETPFTAWYTQLSRRYALTGSQFMGDDLFRAVWFSYVTLQRFEDDMTCTICGTSPETVIWDGITLAFSRKHLSGSLRPPTTTVPESVVRPRVVARPKQQLIVDRNLRKNIRLVVHPPPKDSLDDLALVSPPEISPYSSPPSSSSPTKNPTATSPSKSAATLSDNQLRRQALVVKDHLERVDSVYEELGKMCPALAQVFQANYGMAAFAGGRVPSPYIKNLLIQIAAEESVLQLVNYKALLGLQQFILNPAEGAAHKLMEIPAFYKVVTQRAADLGLVVEIMKWVEVTTCRVFLELVVEGTLPEADPASLSTDSREWMKTGCFYSMPVVRHRPIYPNLLWEKKKKESSGQRGDRCGKYYSQYGERRLTGGIMVCWCSHSICYGFHCIPASEGRDDVFSAMITRWKVAPKRVVYDFACALGPYCMLREPMFFANTFFAIDIFHATGHSKCSPAAFLSDYVNVDTRLEYINSSAAECGNGALRRIRKSVSYMGQERAIIYTKVFLSVWNRLKILRIN